MRKSSDQLMLTTVTWGSLCSHELVHNRIITRLFGLLPIQTLPLSEVHSLRLAIRDEIPTLYFLLNGPHLRPHLKPAPPIYILQSTTRQRILFKLGGRAHFQLRQAIGRAKARTRPQRMAA